MAAFGAILTEPPFVRDSRPFVACAARAVGWQTFGRRRAAGWPDAPVRRGTATSRRRQLATVGYAAAAGGHKP